MTTICLDCNTELDLRAAGSGRQVQRCPKHRKQRHNRFISQAPSTKLRKRNARPKNLVRIQAIKLERGCADCGYDDHAEALHFDHLPGAIKIKDVGRMVGDKSSWSKIEAEIAKCEVVCANCHAVRTAARRAA